MEVMFVRVPFGGATISFAVHNAHNQGERQQVAKFIANNLAVFQQRVSAVLEASQR